MHISTWVRVLIPLVAFLGHAAEQIPSHLEYFGFAAVDSHWDDPHDEEQKTNYIDEVAGFTNIAQMTVRVPGESIRDRLLAFLDAGVKALLHIEPILFEHHEDATSPSGTRIALYPDAEQRFELFWQTNSSLLTPEYIAAIYVVDEPVWNGLSTQDYSAAVEGIKASFPNIPTMVIEAYPVLNQMVVPTAVDWVGFDRYDSTDPANDATWLADLDTVRSARTRVDQKLVIVASTQWLPYDQSEAGLAPEDMDHVAYSYFSLAANDLDVVALIGYLWPGGLDDPQQLGARNLPQNVREVYADIGTTIVQGHTPNLENQIPRKGEIILAEDFEDRDLTRSQWFATEEYLFDRGRTGSGIRLTSDGSENPLLLTEIQVNGLKGCLLALSVNVKGRGITSPPQSWNGIKGMLKVTTQNGRASYSQIHGNIGDFDWTNRGVLAYLPDDVESLTLFLGLEAVEGTVWFDDVRLQVARGPTFPLPMNRPQMVLRPDAVDRLRGAMIATDIDRESLRVLGQEWRANTVRWQLGGCTYEDGLHTADFDAALERELCLLDQALLSCAEFGLTVIVDLHSLARGCFDSLAMQDKLVQAWQEIAARYVDEPAIWAYDLVNEPDAVHGAFGENVALWEDLAERLIREIQIIDRNKVFIIESAYGAPSMFEFLRPLTIRDASIVYSAHVYDPHAFTHQTIGSNTSSYVYPGQIQGESWNKDRLIQALAPVKAFQDKHDVAIFIGEFSAIRWAPSNSAYFYIQDALEIFEEYGWDWCYHAFREWHGWSVEHGEDPNDLEPTAESNARQTLLRSFLERNIAESKR